VFVAAKVTRKTNEKKLFEGITNFFGMSLLIISVLQIQITNYFELPKYR
jgi:hypothetical protein